jgi:aminotransferase
LIKFAARTDRIETIESKQFLEFRRLSREAKDCVSLMGIDPKIMTPRVVREAAKRAMDSGENRNYTDTKGSPELRGALAEKLREENGIEADPNSEIVVTNGSIAAIYATLQALVDVGDEVIMPNPTYALKTHVSFAGGTPIEILLREERDFRVDPEEIAKMVTPRTKLIALVSPHNPTGSVLQKEDLEKVAEIAVQHDLLVLSDELYEKLMFDGNKHFSIASFPGMEDRTITINGFSKGYAMEGWRLGYFTADSRLMAKIGPIAYYIMICANTISQKAALAILTEPEAQKEQQHILKEYEKRRRLLVEGLNKIDGIRCGWPAGSYYFMFNAKSFGMPVVDLATYLLREGKVLVGPGTSFGSGGEGYLRACLAESEENIKEGLVRMEKALERL